MTEIAEQHNQCARCGRLLNTGERAYGVTIWIINRKVCLLCKDALIAEIETHPKNPSLKPITHATI